MDITTHCTRITGPVTYVASSGRTQHIPIGPCLVEGLGRPSVDVIWGPHGQRSVVLPTEAIDAAREQGHLVLLD